MTTFKTALAALTLAYASTLCSAALPPSGGATLPPPPRVSLEDLRSGSAGDLHRLLLESRGVLRVSGGVSEELRDRALGNICDCPPLDSSSNIDEEGPFLDLRRIALPDGTVRSTLGTASGVGLGLEDRAGMTKRPDLPAWVREKCGGEAARDSLEDLRELVSYVSASFVNALDREREGDEARGHYREILAGVDHLEHFHVYAKPSEGVGQDSVEEKSARDEGTAAPTLGYHTDAGFFLAFVPAMDCHSRATDDASFFLEGRDGPATFEDDEVVIVMGAGAQYWLPKSSSPFVAASHALRIAPGTLRAWYGKMHLLPASLTSGKTVEDVPSSFYVEDYDAYVLNSPVDGCGMSAPDGDLLTMDRRLQDHVDGPADCNNVTKFFCWNQCISIPDMANAEQNVADGQSLYCLDPALLSDSEDAVVNATAPCAGGYAHVPACEGSWQDTHDEVPGYDLGHDTAIDDSQEEEGKASSDSDVEGEGSGSDADADADSDAVEGSGSEQYAEDSTESDGDVEGGSDTGASDAPASVASSVGAGSAVAFLASIGTALQAVM